MNNGHRDEIDDKEVEAWEKTYLDALRHGHKKLVTKINEKKILDKEDEEALLNTVKSI